MIRMASYEEALALLRQQGHKRELPRVIRPLREAAGLVLADPVIANVSQPPAPVSAMDGYAVRFGDMAMGAKLSVIGESRAGSPFAGEIAEAQAVRIFTGAIMPGGADHVLIQEDTKREGDTVEVTFDQPRAENIRRKGRDFNQGAQLVPAGHRLTAGAIALAAAGNVGEVSVRRAPRVALLANGDELVEAGASLKLGQVVNSIAPSLAERLRLRGCIVELLGVARDDEADVRQRLETAADVVVSIGGASVGDYDRVRPAFAEAGFEPVFEKVAIKPGKPTWFSARDDQLALGLPGNPAAAMVTARLFLKPLLDAMSGVVPAAGQGEMRAHLSRPLAACGSREEFLRAVLSIDAAGQANVAPAEDQDSSLLHPFLVTNALIRRRPGTLAAAAGDLVEVMRFA